jgi:hypothetical protein
MQRRIETIPLDAPLHYSRNGGMPGARGRCANGSRPAESSSSMTPSMTALNQLQKDFVSFEPRTEREKIVAAEAYRAYNELTESRRARLNSVTQEMPAPLWTLVIAGALICIAVTWCFHTRSVRMHFWMTVLLCSLLGLMIYLTAALDNPYRGKLSVTPDPLERVYQQTMPPGH